MGVFAICLVSMKGDVGCIVKSSLVSYHRITSLIRSFSATIEDIRLSCKSANRSVLGGKKIEDIYPIAQPIPMVVGAYRLLYQLVNDLYIVVIDLDHHSPFLAMDVLNKVKDVVSRVMDGVVSYQSVETNKIFLYYAFRRCINGMEGLSVLNTSLRQIRLANDPLIYYTSGNNLYGVNDVLVEEEISAEAQSYRVDAWETVLQLSDRLPNDIKKELKANLKKEVYDNYFDVDVALPNHRVPDTVITPMADLIFDDDYDANEVLAPLTLVQQSLTEDLPAQDFKPFVPSALAASSEAICHALQLDAKEEEVVAEGGVVEEAEEAEEEMDVPGDTIAMTVPGKTQPGEQAASGAAAEATALQAEAGEEGEAEELNVTQVDGSVEESIVEKENYELQVTQLEVKGEMFIRPMGMDPEGESKTATIPLIIRNAKYTFEPVEGVCALKEESGDTKTFLLTLPLTCKEPVSVLKYSGPMAPEKAPVNAHSQSMREQNVTKLSVNIHANEALPAGISSLMCAVAPPLLSTDDAVKRTHKFSPKGGGFLKKSKKFRWVDQVLESGQDCKFSAECTEAVEPVPQDERDPERCPCEMSGSFLGILSGIAPAIGTEVDPNLHCTYQKHEFTASSSFKYTFNA